MPPTRDRILKAPPEYRRGDAYVVLTGNPRTDRSFSIVMLSCRQAKYALLREELQRAIASYPHLSVHLVPFVCETHALLRGTMPRETWLWDNILAPMKSAIGSNDVDFALFNVEPLKLRWFKNESIDFDVEEVTVHSVATQEEAVKLLRARSVSLSKKPGKLVGNPECEGDLFYVSLYLRPKTKKLDDAALNSLASDDRVRDVFTVTRNEPAEKHLVESGDPPRPIDWPTCDGIFGRADLLKRIGALAVFHIGSGRQAMQELFDWRMEFTSEHKIDLEIMPAAVLHEGVEYVNGAAQSRHPVPLSDEPWEDDEVTH